MTTLPRKTLEIPVCDYFLEENNSDKSSVTVRGCNVFQQKLLSKLSYNPPLMSSASCPLEPSDPTECADSKQRVSECADLRQRVSECADSKQRVSEYGDSKQRVSECGDSKQRVSECADSKQRVSEQRVSECADLKQRVSTKLKSCKQVQNPYQQNKRQFYKVLISYPLDLFC